jgi:hypothetical protein
MKKIIFVVSMVSLSVLGYFAFFKNIGNHGGQTLTVRQPSHQDGLSITQKDKTSSSSEIGVLPEPNVEVQKGLIDEKDLANLKSWDATRGNFSNADLDEYGRLSQNTLEELAKQGDLKAIQTLATNEVILGNSERGKELWNLAAAYGSTKALMWLSSGYGSEYVTSKKDGDALEALAYLNASAKRGDLFAKYRHIDAFYESKGFHPTDEQLKIIDSRSDEILNDLQKTRTELGLPEFDNTPAPELQRIFDALNKK